MRFCILHKPMGGGSSPPPPPTWLRYCFDLLFKCHVFFLYQRHSLQFITKISSLNRNETCDDRNRCENRTETCDDRDRCDGFVDCYWLISNDETNCTEPPSENLNARCDCNRLGNFTCRWDGEGVDRYTWFNNDTGK